MNAGWSISTAAWNPGTSWIYLQHSVLAAALHKRHGAFYLDKDYQVAMVQDPQALLDLIREKNSDPGRVLAEKDRSTDQDWNWWTDDGVQYAVSSGTIDMTADAEHTIVNRNRVLFDVRTSDTKICQRYKNSHTGGLIMDRLEELSQRIRKFNEDRDWDQFHTPVNLAKSISIEANELLECFQWSNSDYDLNAVCEELADVTNYCLQMAQALGVDIIDIVNHKMDLNERKYPVEKARGVSTKYDKL